MGTEISFFNCPLCDGTMNNDGVRFVCGKNPNHIISIDKEFTRYINGEKDRDWLKARMKIRLGKLVHGR